jgi:hypothetical protein
VGRKQKAKRRPDEQEPHMRRSRRARRKLSLKTDTWSEGGCADAAGISVKAGAHYPGKPEGMPFVPLES